MTGFSFLGALIPLNYSYRIFKMLQLGGTCKIIYIYIYIYICICVCVCVCMCMCIYIYILGVARYTDVTVRYAPRFGGHGSI